jgi:Family of unknown function (DUF6062)
MVEAQRDSGGSRRPHHGSQGRDMAYHRFLEALAEPGCPVCSLRHAAVHRYLEGILYESVNDVELRKTLIRSRGFCREHAWELVGLGDSLGTAIIYKDQVAQAIEDVQNASVRSDGGRRGSGSRTTAASGPAAVVRRRRTPEARCPGCQIADEATARYLSALLQHIGNPEVKAAIERSPFLCLPDAMRALEMSQSLEQTRAILDTTVAKLVHLHRELAELIRKRDYRFVREPKGDEQTSWSRAVGQLMGWRPIRRRK